MTHRIIDSPLGPLTLMVDADGHLSGLFTDAQRHFPDAAALGEADDTVAADAVAQLGEYFAGSRTVFDLTLAPRGSAFQRRVWAALAAIPSGQTRTYGELARELGSAARAVGGAVGRNPISIVVPCHRVIGTNGTLTGYAGGTERKRWLLAHEGALRLPG